MTEKKLISKQVARELKAAQALSSALTHYQSASPDLQAALGVDAADALAALLLALAPRVGDAGDALETREQALNEERQDDEPVRDARDEASAQLNKHLISIKSLVSSTFSEEALATYGLSGPIPATSDARRTYARNAAKLLRSGDVIATDPLGRETRASDIAALLEQAAAPLDTAHSDETREALELQDALIARDAASAHLAALSTFSATVLDASLRLVGHGDAADKLAARLRTRPTPSASPAEDADPAS
jgi:hypothetical protein